MLAGGTFFFTRCHTTLYDVDITIHQQSEQFWGHWTIISSLSLHPRRNRLHQRLCFTSHSKAKEKRNPPFRCLHSSSRAQVHRFHLYVESYPGSGLLQRYSLCSSQPRHRCIPFHGS